MPKYFLDFTLKHIEDIYGFQKMKFAQNMPERNYTSTVSVSTARCYKGNFLCKSQQSWVRSQHPPTQWNLRGGRRSSVEYSTKVILISIQLN